MKNLIIVSITALLFGMMFTSCKKTVTNTVIVQDTVPAVPTIVGFWPGLGASVASPQTAPSIPFAFLFNSNGTLRVYIDGASESDTTGYAGSGTGTYTLTGYTLNYTFTVTTSPDIYLGTATLDSSLTFFQSTVGISPATSGSIIAINYKNSKY
jgi:hypothetical protein